MSLISRRRWATLPAVAALATIGAIAPMTPASADVGDEGVVVAEGVVTLPAFPSNTVRGPIATSLCVQGVVVQVAPFVYIQDPCVTAAASASGSLGVSFSYQEPCPAAIGFAAGTLTLGADALGHTPTGSQGFAWVRVGLTAIIQISDTTPIGVGPFTPLPGVDGGAVAVFVPILPNAGNVTGCPPPDDPITAFVATAGAWT